jgi:hypothetical protein
MSLIIGRVELDDAHSRKAAIVPIPIGRNPLTRKGSQRAGRARHARDWDAAVPIPHRLSIRVIVTGW